MIVAIHQPNFIPWLGYFYKIARADVFVMLDDVQYTKNSFINRNRIKTPQGELWLTLPVIHSGRFGQLINSVKIQNPDNIFKKIKKTITANYGKAPFFNEVFRIIETGFYPTDSLAEINEAMIKQILNYLGIEKKLVRSSELDIKGAKSSKRLVEICKSLNADTYLAGFGSSNYQKDSLFLEKGIQPVVYDFKHPEYNQLWGEFVYNLSILDILFNMSVPDINKSLCE